jgi:Ca-activated chloride channel family protein
MRWKSKALKKFADKNLHEIIVPDYSKQKQIVKFTLTLFIFFMLIIGLMNPQMGSKTAEAEQKGIDIMICLDVSNSMKAEDIAPNRLVRAKQSISKLIEKLNGDRIGIIVFAGNAYVQLPITSDYGAAKLFLDNIDTDIAPVQGTSISNAIDLALQSFGKNNANSKSIIVITDGEDHEDSAIESTKNAADNNIIVHCIGMGSPDGSPIPIYYNGEPAGYRKDREGNTIVTKLNENILIEIAATGKGTYVRATNAETGLNTIFNQLRKMEQNKFGTKVFTDYEDRFQPFILISLLLLTTSFFVSDKKSEWWKRLNLFGQKNA